MVACMLLARPLTAQQKRGYHVVNTFHIRSGGGWDYIAVGPDHKLYVSHATQVNVLDQRTGDSVGVIPNTTGVHGIAFVPGGKKGYTSNGRINNVSAFETATGKLITQVTTGENPDAIMYEPFSKKIITCNGRSKSLTLIDPATDKVTATITVGGKPETAVSDNAGRIYVNIEDKNEIVVVNMQSNKIEHRWSLAPAEGPTGLAIDRAGKRLFAGCDKQLVVIDAVSGKLVTTLPIGDGCDGVAFDNNTKTIFASNGEGTLTVVRQQSPNSYTVKENVPTKRGARTLAIDETSHTVYLPTADFGPSTGSGRPPMIPGTFQVLVVKQ